MPTAHGISDFLVPGGGRGDSEAIKGDIIAIETLLIDIRDHMQKIGYKFLCKIVATLHRLQNPKWLLFMTKLYYV